VTRRPAAIADLPVCPVRHLPVPYSSGRNPDGTGRFSVNDPDAKLACALAEWCGVCGRPLDGGDMVFVAALADVPVRPVFPDPPSHLACAGWSMTVCPAITRGAGTVPGWLMWITTTYELIPGRRALFDFRPGPATRLRQFTYDDDGRLREVTAAAPARND
jgi:hypothetical protein